MKKHIQVICAFMMVVLTSLLLVACDNEQFLPIEQYVVSFNTQGGTIVDNQTINRNGSATRPDDPTKDTGTFVDWFESLSSEAPFDFGTPIIANITLYAKWAEGEIPPIGKVTVTFDTQGGGSIETKEVDEGVKVEKPDDPTKVGYAFGGWYIEKELMNVFDFATPITENIILYAKWIENETPPDIDVFIVIFDTQGGTVVEEQVVYKDNQVIKPSDPTKDGYIFVGWIFEGNMYDFNTPLVFDMTLVALWEENQETIEPVNYKMSFDVDGGTPLVPMNVQKGEKAPQLPIPTKDGYKFGGWYIDINHSTRFDETIVVTSDMMLHAKWEVDHDNSEASAKLNIVYGTGKYSGSGTGFSSHNVFSDSLNQHTATTIVGDKTYWEKGDFALRLGSSKAVGSLTYTFAESVRISKVVVYVLQYDGTVKLQVDNLVAQSVVSTNPDSPDALVFALSSATHTFMLKGIGEAKTRVQIVAVDIYLEKEETPTNPEDRKPTITSPSKTVYSVSVGDAFTIPNLTASDANGSVDVVVTGSVDLYTAGIYTITYAAENSNGITTLSIKVYVLDVDTDRSPTITIEGVIPEVLAIGERFILPQAYAIDYLGRKISAYPLGDSEIIRTYQTVVAIVYYAIDEEGNEASEQFSIRIEGQTTVEPDPTDSTDWMSYYDSAEGRTGEALKDALNQIVGKAKATSYDEVKSVLVKADLMEGSTSKLYLIYDSKTTHNKWDNAATWNREHVWPQSKLNGAPKGESHNLRAADVKTNSNRGNEPFVNGTGLYGSRVSGGYFPGDEHKGDVARIVMYMVVRYPQLNFGSGIGLLQTFLKWHNEDPVNAFERNRNDVIHDMQGNRNPFIDHPEMAQLIWGSGQKSVKFLEVYQTIIFDSLALPKDLVDDRKYLKVV